MACSTGVTAICLERISSCWSRSAKWSNNSSRKQYYHLQPRNSNFIYFFSCQWQCLLEYLFTWIILFYWLECSSLGLNKCKCVCPRALAVPPAPNRGQQGDSDYYHKMMYHTSHSVAKRPENRKNNVTVTLWRNFAAESAQIYQYTMLFRLQYHSLAENEIFNFLLKLELQQDQNLI